MKIKFKIALGSVVEDQYSGVKGVAVALTYWVNGCKRVGVQPKCKDDNKMPEGFVIDEAQLTILEGSTEGTEAEMVHPMKALVEDKNTGFKGTITGFSISNAVKKYVVTPRGTDPAVMPDSEYILEEFITVLELPKEVEVEEPAKKGPGGPSEIMRKERVV